MTSTDAPEFPVPVNLRDVHGLRTDDGATVPPGVLYRSEGPRTTEADGVVEWPPSIVIDLRSVEEHLVAHPLETVSTLHRVPMGTALAPALASQTDDRDLVWAYRLLAKDAADEIAHIVELVAHADGPVLVHCTAGKDRTGIVVAVLLSAVGVRRDDVMADYLRTEENLPRLWAALISAGVDLPRNPALHGVQAAALEAVLDDLEAHPQGLRGWLVEHGVPAADLALLAERLLTR